MVFTDATVPTGRAARPTVWSLCEKKFEIENIQEPLGNQHLLVSDKWSEELLIVVAGKHALDVK